MSVHDRAYAAKPCELRLFHNSLKKLESHNELPLVISYAPHVQTDDRARASPHSGNTPHGSPCPSKLPGWFPRSPGGTKRDFPHYISPVSHLSDGPISSSSQVWSLQLPHEATHTTCSSLSAQTGGSKYTKLCFQEILIFSLVGRRSI